MVPPDDIRLSFNEVTEVYDDVRPSYPAQLFDDLFEMLPVEPLIVEVGPGNWPGNEEPPSEGRPLVVTLTTAIVTPR